MEYYYLKIQDRNILKFNLEESYFKILNNQLLPFSLRDQLTDTTEINETDPKIIAKIYTKNLTCIEHFFTNRSLSLSRENAKKILNYLNLSQQNGLTEKANIMFACKALSVTDDYWITKDINEQWKTNNVRSNPLHQNLQQIALFGKSPPSITGNFISPELTTQGMYVKAWYREDNHLYLYKGGTPGGNEAEREVLSSRILDCFNVPHINYSIENKNNLIVSKCKNMVTKDYSIVSASEIDSWCNHTGKNFLDYVKLIDSEMFYKTIVVDYLISNRDRHDGNWGFFMNNHSGKIICLHPLFDHNNAFDNEYMNDLTGGNCQLLPGKTQKEAALYAINHCDFRCIKPISRNIFFNDKMYTTFMERAVELGLYKKLELGLFRKTISYEPMSLKTDNTKKYWNKINSLFEQSIER